MLNMHPIVLGCVRQIHCQHIFCFSLCLPPPPSFVAVVGKLSSSYLIQEEYAANHAASARVRLLKKHMHIYLIFFFLQKATKNNPLESRNDFFKDWQLDQAFDL